MVAILSFVACRMPHTAFLLVITISLILLAGCGKKGPVQPQLFSVPDAPKALTLRQKGQQMVLGWTIPKTNVDGSRAEDLRGFRIKRLIYDPEDGCPTCRDPHTVVADIELDYPAPGQRIGDRIYWQDPDIAIGHGYRYAILPLTIGGMEGPMATAHGTAMPPPPAPALVEVAGGDGEVRLSWEPPALPAATSLIGYNLYRRHAGRPWPIVPVNPEPLTQNRLIDRGLVNGSVYQYRLSTVTRAGDQIFESQSQASAAITPQKSP